MTSISTIGTFPTQSFSKIYTELQLHPPPRLPPPSRSPLNPNLRDKISSLYLHPSLEALLHILNHDLESAHFLVRHMQAPPQVEAMYIHGILHRVEGDYDNARAWYGNICEEECFIRFWGGEGGEEEVVKLDGKWVDGKHPDKQRKVPRQRAAREFLNAIERLNKAKTGDDAELKSQSRKEIDALVEWCKHKFGTEVYHDASREWVQPSADDDVAKKKKDMLTGGSGHRDF